MLSPVERYGWRAAGENENGFKTGTCYVTGKRIERTICQIRVFQKQINNNDQKAVIREPE